MKDIYINIEREYEEIRRKNRQLKDERKKRVYKEIPEIKEIDELIRNIAIICAKEQIISPSKINLQKTNEEIIRLRSQKELLLKEKSYPRNYLDDIYTCLDCKDTGKLYNGEKCHCMEEKVAHELYKESNISYYLEKENFNTFDLNVFSREINEKEGISPRENIEFILKATRKFIKTFNEKNDFNLLFYGPTGQGKTFMLNCIAKELIDENIRVVYQTAFSIGEIIEDYKFRRNEENDYKYRELYNASLLIIDDLGIENSTSITNAGIFNIINERLISGKKTIISTNLTPMELTKVYTDRVTSRVFQKFLQLKFFGEDLRLK